MTMFNRLLVATAAAVAFLAFSPANAQTNKVSAPGPSVAAAQETFTGDLCGNKVVNLVLKTPGADADPEMMKRFGVWGDGEWDFGMCNAIAVTEINGKVATVHYFYGIGVGVSAPGFVVVKDAVMKDKSLFFTRKGYPVTYDLVNGQLTGWYGATKLTRNLKKLK